MGRFRYKAVAPGGEVAEGEMEAPDRAAVIARLQARDHVPIRAEPIEEEGAPTPKPAWWRRLDLSWRRVRDVRPRELALFTRELATLLAAGLPLDRALAALQAMGRGELAPVVARTLDRVRGGAALSAALTGLAPSIGDFYLAMVRAGEAGGRLDAALDRLADYLERAGELADKVASALVYPIVLLVATALSLALLLAYVVPQFEQMFRDAGHALPFATRLLVMLSHLAREWGWAALLLLLAGLIWLRWRLNHPAARQAIDARLLHLPLVGPLAAAMATAVQAVASR